MIKKFKKLIERMGGDPSGIRNKRQAIDALCGCTYGMDCEMVEILPEQGVTGNDADGVYLASIGDGFSIKDNTKYIVKINGAPYTSITFMDGGQSPILGQLFYDNSANEPYEIINSLVGRTELSITWSASLGETITLAIYEEQEVVKPFDYKFMPDGYPKAEVKEIVRSIRLNANGANSANGADLTIATLLYNNPDLATVYHHGEACKYKGSIPQNNNQTTFIYGIDEVERVRITIYVSNGNINEGISAWFNWYADFVDIEIPDTVEVVEKLDPKFLNGGVVVLTEDDTQYTCNYSASELIKMYVENPGQLSTAKFVRRSGAYNLYVSYLTAVNCDPNGDSLMLVFNDMSIEVTPDSVNAVEDN